MIAAFAWVAGYSVYQSQQKEQMSDIALARTWKRWLMRK